MHQSFDSLPPLIIVAFKSLITIIISIFHIMYSHINITAYLKPFYVFNVTGCKLLWTDQEY